MDNKISCKKKLLLIGFLLNQILILINRVLLGFSSELQSRMLKYLFFCSHDTESVDINVRMVIFVLIFP